MLVAKIVFDSDVSYVLEKNNQRGQLVAGRDWQFHVGYVGHARILGDSRCE